MEDASIIEGHSSSEIFTDIDFEITENSSKVFVDGISDKEYDFNEDGWIKVKEPEPIISVSASEENPDNVTTDILISEKSLL